MWSDGKTWMDLRYSLDHICNGEHWEDVNHQPQLKNFVHKHTRQYTGRNDFNGVELYQGDIVSIIFKANRWVESVAEIKFEDYKINFWNDNEIVQAWHEPNPWYHSAICLPWPGCHFEGLEIKVIGNIYEHKELIK